MCAHYRSLSIESHCPPVDQCSPPPLPHPPLHCPPGSVQRAHTVTSAAPQCSHPVWSRSAAGPVATLSKHPSEITHTAITSSFRKYFLTKSDILSLIGGSITELCVFFIIIVLIHELPLLGFEPITLA